MTIYLEMSENNTGFMNGQPLYDKARKASWDGDTMNIAIKDNGDAMSISLDKTDLIDLLGRTCYKSPLEKRLGRLLTTKRKTRGDKRSRCRANTRRHKARKKKCSSRRKTSGRGRSCRRRHTCNHMSPRITFV